MKIFCKFPTVNISKLNFWLVICIAKNFIWTTLKMIFSIFRFFCTLRFQIFKYCPIITNHTSMEILFIQLSFDVHCPPKDWKRSRKWGFGQYWHESFLICDNFALIRDNTNYENIFYYINSLYIEKNLILNVIFVNYLT